MISEQTCLRLADDVTYQSLGPGQDTVMLSLASGYLYTCNGTAADFVSRLDGRQSFGQILRDMQGVYDVAPERLRQDLSSLASRLMDEKLVVQVT